MSRRTFGRAVGMAAVGSVLQAGSAETTPPQSDHGGRPGGGAPDDLLL